MELAKILNITPKAENEIKRIFSQDNPPQGTGLRIKVVTGGCSGLSYRLDFGLKEATDQVYHMQSFPVILDPQTITYIEGMTLDYSDGFKGRGFVFNNPNATKTCSCGESFAI